MAQKPLKRVTVQQKPSKYKKTAKKCKDEDSRIRRAINKQTVEFVTNKALRLESSKSKKQRTKKAKQKNL